MSREDRRKFLWVSTIAGAGAIVAACQKRTDLGVTHPICAFILSCSLRMPRIQRS
jgi:hypothetical protein